MDPRANLAIVEDDEEIAVLLGDFLRREGYGVDVADGGAALDARLGRVPPIDLVILDLMLPGEDGLSICRRLATAGGPPVIILTAKGEDIDRVLGLEIGADDYVTKPFNPRELLARIRAVLRRAQAAPEPVATPDRFHVADLTIDLGGRRVTMTVTDGEIELTSAEFDLLQCFVTRPQRVLSRDQLLDWTRGREGDVFDRTIDVQLSRLRRRLAGSEVADRLKTVRNAGYILAAPVTPGLTMRRIGLVSRVTLLLMAVLLAAIVAAIGFDNWRQSHWHPAVLKQVPHIAQTAAIIDVVTRADPAERPNVLRAVSGEIIRAAILPQVPSGAGLTEAPHVAAKVRSFMQTPAPGLKAYTDGVKRGLAYPGEDLEGVIRRAVLPLPSGQFLVVGVIVYRQPYSFTILGLPSGFWIGMLGVVVAALALVAALRELAPLRRLTESVSRFDGRTLPEAAAAPVTVDPSEIGRLTQAVAEMQARVATLLHERSFLIGAISHDAKTYLTRLRLGAEAVDDLPRRAALIRNVDAVAALIDTALDYARGTTSTGQRGPVDLADLVAVEIAEHEATDPGHAISARLGEAAMVEGDPVALKRVVANLLANAEKFGRRAIEVEVAASGGRCRLAVSDDGPGVPPAERETVFSPFYRLEKSRSRQTGGSGLGLAITRQIVEAHGGKIAIDGAALGGARVVVDLPALAAV